MDGIVIIGMNKKQFKKLCLNYGKDANVDLYELWNYNLRCFDEDEIEKTINIIISTDQYFPTLNRLLEVAKQVVREEDIDYDEKQLGGIFKEKGVVPEWYGKEIENEPIDEETEKEFNEFQAFLEDFRNEKES